jgi:hypothetical protein
VNYLAILSFKKKHENFTFHMKSVIKGRYKDIVGAGSGAGAGAETF